MEQNDMDKKSIDMIYNEVRDKLDLQIISIDNLDTKSSIIIGFIGVMMGVIIGLGKSLSYSIYPFHFCSLLLLLISVVFAFLAYLPKEYRRDLSQDHS